MLGAARVWADKELDDAAETSAPDDDAALAIRAKRDRRAFAALYDRYVGRVYGYCWRRLPTAQTAEDATSLVFTKALAALPGYRDDGPSFRSWLFAIAHNVVADAERRARPEHPLTAIGDLATPLPGPEETALANERTRELRALLVRLPPDQRELLELRLAGLTDREIADALGRGYGAVRVAQHRAIRRLRDLMTVDHLEDTDA